MKDKSDVESTVDDCTRRSGSLRAIFDAVTNPLESCILNWLPFARSSHVILGNHTIVGDGSDALREWRN